MVTKQSAIMNQASSDHASVVGAYRFLANPRVELDKIQDSIRAQAFQSSEASDELMVLMDTSVISLQHNAGRLKVNDPFIGPIDDKGTVGFLLHAALVVDATCGFPLGISSVCTFNRQFDQPDRRKRKYKKQPVSSKESVKWQRAALESLSGLKDKRITFVSDRESDIYEYLSHLTEQGADFIIRAQVNRPLVDRSAKLFDLLPDLPLQGQYSFEAPGNKHRKAHRAKMEVRFTHVQIKRPVAYQQGPEALPLYVVQAREVEVPKGEEPLYWTLLTSKPVESLTQALEVIKGYQGRFLIEELFKLVKHKGLQLEDVQLESGEALQKLACISLQVALAVMQMRMERDNQNKIAAQVVFTQAQQAFIAVLVKHQLEGKTQKQKNPYPEGSLAWATWCMARLGGWKCYGPPAGIISLKRGLDAFAQRYEGWLLAKEFRKSA